MIQWNLRAGFTSWEIKQPSSLVSVHILGLQLQPNKWIFEVTPLLWKAWENSYLWNTGLKALIISSNANLQNRLRWKSRRAKDSFKSGCILCNPWQHHSRPDPHLMSFAICLQVDFLPRFKEHTDEMLTDISYIFNKIIKEMFLLLLISK